MTSKEFAGASDNGELFAEEKKTQQDADRHRLMTIPGMIAPHDANDGANMNI